MRCPKWLKDEAAEFWSKHAKALADAGTLTERDVESFSLLCEIWRLIRRADLTGGDSKEAIRFIALTKQYQSLAKQFGLLPKDRRNNEDGPDAEELIPKL